MTKVTAIDRNRRALVKATGAVLTGSLVSGCLGGNNDPSDDDGGNDPANGNDGGGGDTDEVEEWMTDANEYDDVEDRTGGDEVTVDVGTGSNGFGFTPAAMRIDTGTTVVWEWTGMGGSHNVVDTDGEFESELLTEEGETFEHTFDDAGTYTYSCIPHEGSGMKGAVIIE